MSSKIEWTDETWNPTLGCERVSAGCDNCYAIRQSRMRAGNPNAKIAAAHRGLTMLRDGELDWSGQVRLLPERLQQPLRWKRPRRVFVDSLTDLFHKDVPDEFIALVWAVMAATPQHTYQLLTKRHGRMRSLLSAPSWPAYVADVYGEEYDGEEFSFTVTRALPNLHLGVSVEDQAAADLRIPALLDTPAAVRWISAEPLLGPVDLTGPWDPVKGGTKPRYWLAPRPSWGDPEPVAGGSMTLAPLETRPAIDWVVVGGESGPGARPMHPEWARSLRDQCAYAGVPFHFKQWGDWSPRPWSARVPDPTASGEELAAAKRAAEQRGASHAVNLDGYLLELSHRPWSCERDDEAPVPWAGVSRVGKKTAGRELDGVLHDGVPVVVAS